MLKVSNLTLIHDKKCILYDVSCELLPGKITAFIGESGSGKTTLFKCIAQLFSHYTGSIAYNNTPLSSYSSAQRINIIGFVSQTTSLFPNMTVLQNCMHPMLSMLNLDEKTAKSKALTLLELLGIQDLHDRYPKSLSGGQQQRVAIARALGLNPRVLLLDEVTAALDPHSEDKLQHVLKNLCMSDVTIALSSHDMHFVKQVFDRVYLMERGRIVEQYDAQQDGPLDQTQHIKAFLHEPAWKGDYE